MATQAERRARTRQRLIDAAKLLFDKHGFDAVAVDQIVKEADVAKGTFYQYYQTKVDVLADLARDEGAVKIRQALDEVADGFPALAMLERFLSIQCQWFEQHEKVAAALVMASLNGLGWEEIREDEHRHSRVFIKRLIELAQAQGTVRPELDAKEVAMVIGGAVVVQVLVWSRAPVSGGLYASISQSLAIVFDGIRTGEAL